MDRAALRSVESEPGVPPSLRGLPSAAAGLLAEFQAGDESERGRLEEAARDATGGLALHEPPRFTHDAIEQARLWRIRQGMFPSVGAVRKSGTTVIIEDVAFPVERLADAAVDLNALFGRHGYGDGIIFGHARDGNLHFVITQSFCDRNAVDQYARFMDDVVSLVVAKYDGALKAEHGTGRNMAPFVETEWGPEAYAVMVRLKELADPDGLLNPGVVVNPDRRAHLTHLKALPTVEPEVDKCIECGFCEPLCPSRELTLTPRQRIVVRREIRRLEETSGDRSLLAALERDFPYDALDTCAADGLCATACPVRIDTGRLTKRFRAARHAAASRALAVAIARRFRLVPPALRSGLRAGHFVQSLFGPRAMEALTMGFRALAGGRFPLWSREMPRAAKSSRPRTTAEGAQAVYFPSCISRTMGALPGEPPDPSVMEAMVAVSGRAGIPIFIPDDVEGICCGVPFSSKGYRQLTASPRTGPSTASGVVGWRPPSRLSRHEPLYPGTSGVAWLTFGREREEIRRSHDPRRRRVRPRHASAEARRYGEGALGRPPSRLLGDEMDIAAKLEAIARACAGSVVVPPDAGCCAFAATAVFSSRS